MGDNDSSEENATTSQWDLYSEQMGGAFKTLQQNLEAHHQFIKSLSEGVTGTDSVYPDPPGAESQEVEEGYKGLLGAYTTWVESAQEMFEHLHQASENDEELDLSEIREIWLTAANRAFKEFMSTDAFSAMTGNSLEVVTDLKEQLDETMQDTLQNIGMPTTEDLSEVGKRLVELERRQQRVENKLDEILEKLD